jgi:hypothetical protein
MEKTASVPRRKVERVLFWVLASIMASELVLLGILVIEGIVFLFIRWGSWPWLLGAVGTVGAALLAYLIYRLARAAYRRRFQFSLRGLVIAVAILALLLATTGRKGIDAWQRHSLHRDLSAAGGELYQLRERRERRGVLPPHKPGWMELRLADDSAGQFDSVDLYTDAALRMMAERLDCFSHVENLILGGPGITDDGVGSAHGLGTLPRLRSLSLIEASISDDGLRLVCNWPQVETLCINGCGLLTDDGLAHLMHLKRLKRLMLVREGGTLNVSAAGLLHLRRIPQLESLLLAGIPVGDDELESIAKLQRLKGVNLIRTGVTQTGAKRLRAALPNCRVTLWPKATSDTPADP